MNFLKINTLYIELTHACNQHCKHCYLNGGTPYSGRNEYRAREERFHEKNISRMDIDDLISRKIKK